MRSCACRRWRTRSRTWVFRTTSAIELSWAKLVGVVLLLAPVPARLKEWAYAGIAIDLGSALIAHVAVGDGPQAWGWAAATAVLWALSYLFWRAAADKCGGVNGKRLKPRRR